MTTLKELRQSKIDLLEDQLKSLGDSIGDSIIELGQARDAVKTLQADLRALRVVEQMTVDNEDCEEVTVECTECAGKGRVTIYGHGGAGKVGTADCDRCQGRGELTLEEPEQLEEYEAAAMKAGML